ncbi:hypothetical protein KUTeg_008036 [Tegillarca granosa]|uniref:Uncharacterized protein n=1 Tax=Tegillarca granosa TaxID=220873 RepID=A0ABQ9FFG8_TEGGR|nr:hypothetical protein KUTeg_008036 [Tegillarca granosa]
MSSQGGLKAAAGFMPYCVSKAMVDMLTKVTALELGPHKIRVNSVNPTILKTDMTKDFYENEEFMQMFRAKHPLGKFATVKDVVNATMFLLSDDSAMITGSSLPVDGGILINASGYPPSMVVKDTMAPYGENMYVSSNNEASSLLLGDVSSKAKAYMFKL